MKDQESTTRTTVPNSVVIRLNAEQQRTIKSLYDVRTVENNGGPMFGVFGQAYVDPLQTAGEFGTAQFYWLNQEQYDHVRAAIVKALYSAPAPQPVLDTGEWVIEETFSGKVLIRDSQDQPVARVNRRQDAVQIVSDHRSAAAVPGLVEALKAAKKWHQPPDLMTLIDAALTTVNQIGGEK
jgi:hypothetical protein